MATLPAFDLAQILRILPHRAPFVLLDRIVDIQPRRSARALKCVTYNEPFFPGHFPGRPIFPGVLILEALAQLVAVLAYASEPFDSSQKIVYFMGIDRARFRTPVVPGDRMLLEIEVLQRKQNIWKCSAAASVDETIAAEAELLAAIVDRDEE
ncbi:MAG: 3-hydroxyacyl-ACP dehydratase FabZ [Polyangiales bacterium]